MKRSLSFLLVTIYLTVSIAAQITNQTKISGTVTDAAGAAINDAEVRLLNVRQLVLGATKTDAEGRYKFENVAVGSYVVIASRSDFSPQREAVRVFENSAAEVNLKLEVNQLSEQVTVTAETGLAEDVNKIPQQINVISADAIRQRTTAVLAQVADEETGVALQRTSPTIGAVLVRGLTEVGVYVDGVRYTNSTQRGGINTFFNLNEPTSLSAVEIQRSPNTALFGTDGLGGNVQLISRQPQLGFDRPKWNGEFNSFFTSADGSFGSNALLSYGTKRFGVLGNLVARRINTLRTGGGIDSHSAITRFLDLPSDITGDERLPDTAFTQYGGTFQMNFAPTDNRQISFRYQRSQQDGGKRYDQLLGGDGNLISDLRNLMLDFTYLRYNKQSVGFFDSLSATISYNSQRVNQGGQGNPLASINNRPLFPDDSAGFEDFSGRIGAVVTLVDGLNLGLNFSRGFRAPNITSLGSLGLVGVGFQVSTTDVVGLGAFIGTTGNASAVSTGVPVAPLISETSNNYDVSLRYRNRRFEANLTGYVIDYDNTIVRQTLILPPGAVGRQLGSQTIVNQNANGAIFVPASTTPVLVQVNFNNTRLTGVEFNFDYRFLDDWTTGGNYSYVYAADRITGEPPNLGGGGITPQFAFLRLRYKPAGKRYWIEGYANGAGRQSRLSTLDLADRRTGAERTRTQIRNFFSRGACVRGITMPGTNGQCGTAGGILVATGETLGQVQNRLLPIGAVVNGIRIVNNDTAVPLFTSIPGYVLFNVRGGYRFSENQELTFDFENIADKNYRAPGWGIDGGGRSLTVRYQYRF